MVEERETEDIGNGGIEVEVETEEKLFFPLLLRLRRVLSPGMDSFSGNGGKSWVEKPSSEVSSHLPTGPVTSSPTANVHFPRSRIA